MPDKRQSTVDRVRKAAKEKVKAIRRYVQPQLNESHPTGRAIKQRNQEYERVLREMDQTPRKKK